MHLKPAAHCLQQGFRVECTCRAEISAGLGSHKEHQDPDLPLFYGAGNELWAVGQYTQELPSAWFWSTVCIGNAAFSSWSVMGALVSCCCLHLQNRKGKAVCCVLKAINNWK